MKPAKPIESLILTVRGRKVLVDADLAEIYGVSTKRLNQQVKRNAERFPEDFLFRLDEVEKREVVANCDHLARLTFASVRQILLGRGGPLCPPPVDPGIGAVPAPTPGGHGGPPLPSTG